METSALLGLEANPKGGFSQIQVTTRRVLLADQTIRPKVQGDPSALPTDRSVDHLPAVAALLAQTAMGAAVHSGTVVGLAQGASPVEASPAAIRLEVSLVGIPLEVSPVVAVAVVDNHWAGIVH
jgi:hypothetical protein